MSDDVMLQAGFSFLLAGPTWQFDLPSGMAPVRSELQSPITTGFGGRTAVFTAGDDGAALKVGLEDQSTYVGSYESAGALETTLRKRNETPDTWWLIWQVDSGLLTVHLRPEDEPESRIEEICGAIEIAPTSQGTPVMLLSNPISPAISTARPAQERAVYALPSNLDVKFVRPGFLDAGVIYASDEASGAAFRAGIGGGIEVLVYGDESGARSVLDGIMGSFAEASA